MNNELNANNNFPKVGLISVDNSGERLLINYIEKITEIKVISNINNNFSTNKTSHLNSIDKSWFVHSDYPFSISNKNYIEAEISMAVLLIRNPVDLLMSRILQNNSDDIDQIENLITEWIDFINFWIEAPIPILIVRYEDIAEEPITVLSQLFKFIFGKSEIEETLIDTKIKSVCATIMDEYKLKDNNQSCKLLENKNFLIKLQQKFDEKLLFLMRKFNYEASDCHWLLDYNLHQIKESITLHSLYDKYELSNTLTVMSIY